MEEIWKPVVGWEDKYEVSNLGQVRNKNTEKIRKLNLTPDGYQWLTLTRHDDGVRLTQWYSVHQLVAQAFLPNPLGLEEIDHIDHCRTNNVVTNLEWVTRNENQRRCPNLTRKHPVPVAQYTEDGEFVAAYKSATEAYKITGINYASILRCARGVRHRKSAGGYKWELIGEEDYERYFNKN